MSIATRLCAALLALALVAACKKSDTTVAGPTTHAPDASHGSYLVAHLSACGDCHTPRDMMGMPIDSLAFAGGNRFDMGAGHAVYSKNITSDSLYGIGIWTDSAIVRAIRVGIAPMHAMGGSAFDTVLLPIMPYWLFAYYTDDDVADIVAYLRTLRAVHRPPPPDSVPQIIRTPNAKLIGISEPFVVSDQTTRGKYLVTVSGCIDCHTPSPAGNPGALDMSKFLAGGKTFPGVNPGETVHARNITPDSSNGIGKWTHNQIDSAMAFGWDDQHKAICPPMPWPSYTGLTQADRDAIIAYITNIPAKAYYVTEDNLNCPHP